MNPGTEQTIKQFEADIRGYIYDICFYAPNTEAKHTVSDKSLKNGYRAKINKLDKLGVRSIEVGRTYDSLENILTSNEPHRFKAFSTAVESIMTRDGWELYNRDKNNAALFEQSNKACTACPNFFACKGLG